MSTLDKLEMVKLWAQNIIDATEKEQQERAASDDIERLRAEIGRLTDEKADLIHTNQELHRQLRQHVRPNCEGECGDPTPVEVSV